MADHPFTGTLSVTGNVGIGTEPLPNTQLYIRSSTEQSQVLVENSVGTLFKLAVDSSGVAIGTDTGTTLPFSLQTNGVSHLSINNSGLVEVSGPLSIQNTLTVTGNAIVGTDDTPATLAVKGTIQAGSATITGPLTVQNNLTVQNDLTVTGNLQVTGTTTFRDIQRHQGDLELGDEDTDQVRIHGLVRSTHSSGALQIRSSMNISDRLTVTGNATLNNTFLGNVGHGSLWAGFSHSNSATTAGYGLLQHRDGIFTLLNKKSGGGYLGFRVDNADKMIINDAGNVGIGTTEPRTQLHVLGRISTGRDFASAGAITFYPPDGFAWFHIDNGPSGGRPLGRLRISHGGNPGDREIISILQNMNVGIGTTAPAFKLDVAGAAHASSFPTSSDKRLKTNVNRLSNVLEKLDKIEGISFEWNELYESLGRSTGHREIGVTAQDVEAVFPELVTTWGEEGYKAVDYGRLAGVLIEAVKELKAENALLRRRVEALEK